VTLSDEVESNYGYLPGLEWKEVYLEKQDFTGLEFYCSCFKGARFNFADFEGADFNQAKNLDKAIWPKGWKLVKDDNND
jgi:uncharacterized protein YjbI with pentapeptide repeats